MHLDFSEFHPLDHWAFDEQCRSLPGGGRRHLKLWLDYQSPDPAGAFLCKINRHSPTDYWKGRGRIDLEEPPTGKMCDRCWKEL